MLVARQTGSENTEAPERAARALDRRAIDQNGAAEYGNDCDTFG